MICYSPRPQNEYALKAKKPDWLSHMSFGLGDLDLVSDPLLWNYCVVTSRLPFLWEDKKVKKKNKPTVFPNLELAKRDLLRSVNGSEVAEYMKVTPLGFLQAVDNNPVRHLEVCKFFKSEEAFRSVVTARISVWMLSKGMEVHPDNKALIAMVRRKA